MHLLFLRILLTLLMLQPFHFCLFSLQVEKMNVEALSRAELLTLLSILEGELEAQDVVIHTLRVSFMIRNSTHV